MIDDGKIIEGLMGLVMMIGGFFVKNLHSKVVDLEKELTAHKVESAKTFATTAAIERLSEKIDDGFQRIYDKLDQKADRT